MSHADTIRRHLEIECDHQEAFDALNAWEAENRRLRDALQRLKGNVWEWEVPADVREQVDAALDGTPSAAQGGSS